MKKKNTHLIEVKNLSKSFGDKKVLNNISFELNDNEILGIVGFSGEGKSTLLNLICGLEKIDSGEIKFNGLKYGKKYIQERKKILGYSSQNHSYYDELTLIENLEYFGALYNLNIKEVEKKSKELIQKFNLENVRGNMAYSLSEGQKKRLDLACSLIHEPRVLILDEPTANLDFKLRDELLEYIGKIKKQNISVIFVSHNLEEVENICDRVIMLNKTKTNIIDNPKKIKSYFNKFIKEEVK